LLIGTGISEIVLQTGVFRYREALSIKFDKASRARGGLRDDANLVNPRCTRVNRWAYENGITLKFSRRGQPTDNAFVESFNCRPCDHCFNAHWFLSLAAARAKIAAGRRKQPSGGMKNRGRQVGRQLRRAVPAE
jgi:transposase InsO family protein